MVKIKELDKIYGIRKFRPSVKVVNELSTGIGCYNYQSSDYGE